MSDDPSAAPKGSAADPIVIVGAGQAAQSLLETLRGRGFTGRILLLGDEPVAPYQRPPLSKKYLLGEMSAERLALRPPGYYDDMAIETRFGERVAEISPADRTIRLESGETIAYGALALTTGSRPRLLPESIGGRLPGVYPARTIADIDAMAAEFVDGRTAVIVGGGYIGLEAAAVAAQLGVRVIVVEMAPRILARVAAEETAAYFSALHAAHGVEIRTGAAVARLEAGSDGRVSEVILADGERLRVDFVLVGVGVAPNAELAEAAGLAIDNGVAVDATGRTSDPHIYAAGDCASFPYGAGRVRLESVQNAIDQAAVIGRTLMGEEARYAPVPWFWSDQYDVKLQIAGLSQGYDRAIVRPGRAGEDGKAPTRSVWYIRDERLIAVDAMNEPRAYMTGKRWLQAGVSPDLSRLGDPSVELKTLV